MEGVLSGRCRKDFLSSDRDRGEQVREQLLVTLHSVGSKGVRAFAIGSQEQTYQVALDLEDLDEEMLGLYCECPRFISGENCKHTWAVLRQLESEYELKFSKTKRLSIYECPDALVDVGPSLAKLSSNGNGSPNGNKQRSSSSGGGWHSRLLSTQRIAKTGSYSANPSLSAAPLLETRTWFAISLTELVDANHFKLRLYQSKPKKDGDFSIPTKVSLAKSELPSLRNLDEYRALSQLDWNTVETPGYSYNGPSDRDYRSYLHLPTQLLGDSLKALCATGRFVWTMEDSRSLTDVHTLEADVDTTWQFQLHLQPAEKEGRIDVLPRLTRRSVDDPSQIETRGVEKVVGVCASGAILFEETIGLVRSSDVGWVRGWQRQNSLHIPRQDLDRFLKTIFGFENPPELVLDERLGVDRSQGVPRGKLKLAAARMSDDYLKAEVFFQYEQVELTVADERNSVWLIEQQAIAERDRQAESALLEHLHGFPFSEVRFHRDESELRIHRKWFAELVHKLSDLGWEVLAEGKAYRSAAKFDIKVSSGEDWFDLNADVDFDGLQASLPQLLEALRGGERFVLLDDGTHGVLPEKWLERLSGLSKMGKAEGEAVRFRRNQALLLDMLLAEQPEVSVDRQFSECCRRLKKFSGIEPMKQPRGFQGELRGYQREGLGWFRFLKDFEFGGCLADDMGLGKTIQVLALLESRRVRRLKEGETRKPSIAIVPKSLVFNWIEEAAKFAPKLRVLDYTGIDREERLSQVSECDLIVTTYATFRLDVEQLKEVEFDYAILDEAQAIKNPKSQASKAVRLLTADHRLAMTGTPVENHLGDLWSLFDFLNPGMLGSSTASSYSFSTETDQGRLQALSNALRPFILRRTKGQVLTELPQKTEQTLYCDMPPKQRKLYDELRDHYRASLKSKVKEVGIQRSKIHVLEALLRLRQAACDPRLIDPKQKVVGAKLELLIEQLSGVVAEGHKALIFSQFTSLLALVKQQIDAQGWKYEYLDGKTNRRAEHVKRFQEESDCSLFLISLKAGGHGLNLTAAEYVYILDPWWNPAVEAQAIDRAHRMGQCKPVMAYRMIARDTVEDKIVQLQQNKRELADAIISADKSLIKQLSAEDLQILFE